MTSRFVAAYIERRVQGAVLFALYLLAAAAVHFPHYGSYVGDITRDFYLHYNWAKEFAENLALGNPYPRWMFHGRLGLGEPVFVFYAPLYYYLVAFCTLLGMSTWAATQVVAVITTATFAGFVFKTVSYYADDRLSAGIGLVALASPFLVMLNYKFDGPAWATMGYASHGFLFWALFRPGASNRVINVWAAVAIGIAVGSHVISALINLICYSTVALFPVSERGGAARFVRSIAAWGITVVLGLALSAIYLVPALGYLDLIRSDVWEPSVPFTAFSWPLITQFLFDQRWFSFQWTISFPALILVVVPITYVLVHKDAMDSLLKAVAVGAVALFFASELSFPLWALNTPLIKVQLPFRFISVVYTVGIVATGLTLAHARISNRKIWRTLCMALLTLSFITGVLTLVKASYLDGRELPAELEANQYTFLPFIKRLQEEGECPQGDKKGGDLNCFLSWGASGSFRGTAEYRLDWAGVGYGAYASAGFAAECAAKGMLCGEAQRTSTGLKWEVSPSGTTKLVLPVFHFPSWVAYIDGRRVTHTIDTATGLIAVVVPGHASQIQVAWSLSNLERSGLYLSCTALLILVCASVARRFSARP